MRTRLTGMISLLFVLFALMLATPAVAVAEVLDTDADDLVTGVSGGTKSYKLGAPAAEVRYWVSNPQGPFGSDPCEITYPDPDVPAYVTINVPQGVSVSSTSFLPDSSGQPANTLKFEACGGSTYNFQTVRFTADAEGNYPITASVDDGYPTINYILNYSAFTLVVSEDPTVTDVAPPDGATGVAIGTNVEATFSEAMDASTADGDPSTITDSTFNLTKPDGSDADSDPDPVSATVSYDSAANKATLTPNAALDHSTQYTATVTTGAQDLDGNALDQDAAQAGTQPESWSFATAAPPDITPPVISKDVTGTSGNNGWYSSDVNVDWTVSDPESDISSQAGCDDVSVTTDQAATTYTCEATSAGGTSSDSVTIKRDATAPTLTPSVSPNPVLLNGSATADAGAQDNLSGIASQSCDPVDTTNVGANKSVSCSATDNAGNTNSASANYSVNYKFVGFSSPVDNGGVLNVVKAGQTIPLKWQIMDAKDVPVTNLSSSNVKVSVANLSCGLSTTTDQLEEVAAGSSGLQNLGGGYYQLNWKSPTSYAKSCKTLTLDLGEGTLTTPHTALFKFSK